MTNAHASTRRSEQGFTLVELAIVMVIIGLLIGGILKGQELIANAKISATVSQLKGMDAAFNTFQDKYNATPGDMTTPNTRLPGCAALPCSQTGDGNSRVDEPAFGNVPGTTDESAVAFAHLNASDLISGIDTANSQIAFGRMLPAIKAGGGMWVSYANAAIANTGVGAGRHYAILTGSVTNAAAAGTGAFSPTTAAQIDRKLDDGTPTTGVFSVVGGANCNSVGANGVYNEAQNSGVCTGYFRVLN